jgi:NCAIR mutase (PurE)-related protein
VISAGTPDLPVAAEAIGVARRFGNEVETIGDVGVAALLRILTSCASHVSAFDIDDGFGAA